jgi:hypothetical protein
MGGAWGLVAFFGPVGLNVPEMALRSLRGTAGGGAGSRRSGALGNLYAITQSVERQQAIRDAAEKIAKQQQRNVALIKAQGGAIKGTTMALIEGKPYRRRGGKKKRGPRAKR